MSTPNPITQQEQRVPDSTTQQPIKHCKEETKESRVERLLTSEPESSFLLRRHTVLSIILVYLFIGLPVWFKLTEIYRAPLPGQFIDLLQTQPFEDLRIHNFVKVEISDGLKYPDLARAVQIQVNEEIRKLNADEDTKLAVAWNVTLIDDLDECSQDVEYSLNLEIGGEEGISVDEVSKNTILYYTLKSVKNNDLPFFVTQTLMGHIFKSELDLLRLKNLQKQQSIKETALNSISYSPKVHLSFKLLTGDGLPVQWEIEEALKEYFQNLVRMFGSFIEFTIDTEIKYFTELNLKDNDPNSVIELSDLSAILDFSDWDISSDQFSYPSLNFILYFPSARQAPLNLQFSKDDYNSEAFLIPQWGAIILHKDPLQAGSYITKEYLYPALESFTSELFTLIGLPKDPKNPLIRLDALMKFTILENLKKGSESLFSLMKLTKSLPNISIPKSVQSNVQKALEARSEAVKALSFENDFQSAFVESIKVLKFAELAFFDNKMVQQNFFPQEHKIAVYMPLLGPLTMICAIGGLRVLNEVKLLRRKRLATSQERSIKAKKEN